MDQGSEPRIYTVEYAVVDEFGNHATTDCEIRVVGSGPPGASPDSAGVDCLDILENGGSTGDGTYWIDPDGDGGADPFEAYCDMTTSGGGWTLVAESMGGSGIPGVGAQGTLHLDESVVTTTAKLDDATINAIIVDRDYLVKCQRGSVAVPATMNRMLRFTTTNDWVTSTSQALTITPDTITDFEILQGPVSAVVDGTFWADNNQSVFDLGAFPGGSNQGWTFYHSNIGPYCGEAHNSGTNVQKVFVR